MIFTIQELYTNEDFQKQAQEFFNTQAQIQLQQFVTEDSLKEFKNELLTNKTVFKQRNQPLTHKYESIPSISEDVPMSIQHGIEYFKSKQFQDFIEKIVGFDLELKEYEISKFSHKSFELIHDSKITNSLLIDIYFFITKDEFENTMGGQKVYTTFEEELFYLTPEHNTLTCVFRDEELRQYTKYINCLAKDKEYVQIKTTFEISDSIQDELI